MAETAQIRNLRKLLGSQNLEEERCKGKRIREASTLQQTSVETPVNCSETADNTTGVGSPQPHSNAGNLTSRTGYGGAGRGSENSRKLGSDGLKDFAAPWSDSENTDLDEPDLETGQESEAGQEFVPILAASRFPYKFLSSDKEFMESVAGVSFNNGQFWKRKWTVFCLACPQEINVRLLFLVPRAEVEKLFSEAGLKLNTTIKFPERQQDPGFCISFSDKAPRPCYVGVSRSREDFDSMEGKVPGSIFSANVSSAEQGDDRSWQTFREKVEAAVKSAKAKRSKNTAKNKIDRAAQKSIWDGQLQHAQCYLGLREGRETLSKSSSMEKQTAADSSSAPAFKPLHDIVFVAVDVEAHERYPSMITEIGVSTLDTRDVKHIAPGPAAKGWRDLIKYRHLRIEEYRNHKNNEFVNGCPDRFEKEFGESEFISRVDIPKAMALCCKPPFHHKVSHILNDDFSEIEPDYLVDMAPRKIVLVGHDINSDIGYLKSVGFDILGLSSLVETIDTSLMHRALTGETQPTSLGGVLHQFEIPSWNLHNAGNDAGYTMQALLAISVEHLANRQF